MSNAVRCSEDLLHTDVCAVEMCEMVTELMKRAEDIEYSELLDEVKDPASTCTSG